jgi:hypothetical protein
MVSLSGCDDLVMPLQLVESRKTPRASKAVRFLGDESKRNRQRGQKCEEQ